MLDRETFLKRRKKLISRGPEPEVTPELRRRLEASAASAACFEQNKDTDHRENNA